RCGIPCEPSLSMFGRIEHIQMLKQGHSFSCHLYTFNQFEIWGIAKQPPSSGHRGIGNRVFKFWLLLQQRQKAVTRQKIADPRYEVFVARFIARQLVQVRFKVTDQRLRQTIAVIAAYRLFENCHDLRKSLAESSTKCNTDLLN